MLTKCESDDRWLQTKQMADLDHELKAVVVTPFCLANLRRLGVLKAAARKLDW